MGMLSFEFVGVVGNYVNAMETPLLFTVLGDAVEGRCEYRNNRYTYSPRGQFRLVTNVYNFDVGRVQIWDASSTARAALIDLRANLRRYDIELGERLLRVRWNERKYLVLDKGPLSDAQRRQIKGARLFDLRREVGWVREMLSERNDDARRRRNQK